MLTFDSKYREKGFVNLCGCDEAGRGPLAGPVVAAAVLFSANKNIVGVNDSKKLTEKMREKLFPEIKEQADAYAYKVISPNRIDEINILQASLEGMRLSVNELNILPNMILIDGNKTFHSTIQREAIVKGDSKSFVIACASIIAKVTRDNIMMELAKEHPAYGWDHNKGYPTKDHIRAVLKYGPTKYHRKSFLKNITKWEQDGLYK